MKRRTLLQSGALALPSLARSQVAPPGGAPVTVGMVLDFAVPDRDEKEVRDEWARLGWREGVNLRFELRTVDARLERLDATVRELLALRPAVLIASNDNVASLQRPGGSVTGLVYMFDDIRPKLYQLARQVAPKARRFGAMFFYAGPPNPGLDAAMERGRQLARQVIAEFVPLQVRDVREIDAHVASLTPASDHVLLVNFDPGLYPEYARIAALTRAAKLPSVSMHQAYAPAGGLLSYGAHLNGIAKRALQMADQVLRGARVGDIPIEQPTLIHLTLNKRTAREIGLTFPQELLVRADEVIE
jgi:putative ABC transport system substrate-binding protein